jgi:hypothetical protein
MKRKTVSGAQIIVICRIFLKNIHCLTNDKRVFIQYSVSNEFNNQLLEIHERKTCTMGLVLLISTLSVQASQELSAMFVYFQNTRNDNR